MDKEDVVHMYSGIQLSHKSKQYNAICSNMGATKDYHTNKGNQKDRHHIV